MVRRRRQVARWGPTYLRMLVAIVVSYALIIGFGDTAVGRIGRMAILAYLLWYALALRRPAQTRRWVVLRRVTWTLIAIVLAASSWAALAGSQRVASGMIGGLSFLITTIVIFTIAATVIGRGRVDTPTVLGVLCIYLLLATLFASLNQLLSSFADEYLKGVTGLPTAADQLYFSVITLATVGYGDITPATEGGRAVAVVEAVTGQLYLVSVVAAVVAGWRANGTRLGGSSTTESETGDTDPPDTWSAD